jgi:hypothetical protein
MPFNGVIRGQCRAVIVVLWTLDDEPLQLSCVGSYTRPECPTSHLESRLLYAWPLQWALGFGIEVCLQQGMLPVATARRSRKS